MFTVLPYLYSEFAEKTKNIIKHSFYMSYTVAQLYWFLFFQNGKFVKSNMLKGSMSYNYHATHITEVITCR
jgi:hypothetical protein